MIKLNSRPTTNRNRYCVFERRIEQIGVWQVAHAPVGMTPSTLTTRLGVIEAVEVLIGSRVREVLGMIGGKAHVHDIKVVTMQMNRMSVAFNSRSISLFNYPKKKIHKTLSNKFDCCFYF